MSSTIAFDIIARDKASGKFDQFGNSVEKSGGKLKKFAAMGAAALAAGGLAAGKFALDAVGAASDVQQSFGALESVYGKNAQRVKKWAEGAAESVGLAKSEYSNLSALVGSQLQGMGVATDKSAKKSNELIKMGADLAATYGGSVREAVEAVSSTLKGETDPIERYGVSIKASDISARMAADGLDKLEGAAKKQATAQTVLAMLTEQTGKAQGAFGRESETLAGQQERLGAKFENLKATLGENLLPIMTSATSAASDFITELQTGEGTGGKVAAAFKTVADNLDTIAPVLGVVTGGFIAYAAAAKVAAIATAIQTAGTVGATGATWSLNAALRANPIGLVVTALTALGVGFVIAYKKSETFRTVVDGALTGVKKGFDALGKAGTWLWNNALQPAFKFIVNGVASILDLWSTMLAQLGKVPGFGWAKDAADAMGAAADKARGLADGIRKIPNKTVTVTVAYKYTGRKGGAGSTRGDSGGELDPGSYLGRGQMRDTIQSATAKFFDALADGIKKGGKKLDTVLDASRTRLRDKLGGIRDEMKSMGESIASALNQVDFGGSLADHLASLTGTNGALTNLMAVFDKLKSSVSKDYLSALMQSGNIGLATALANDPAAAAQASALYDANASMAQGLGEQTAQQVLGDKIEKALELEIGKLVRELKDSPSKTARELRKEIKELKLVVEGLSAGQRAYLRGAN